MHLHLLCEPVEASAYWVTDMVNGIVRESLKKGLDLITYTDGQVQEKQFSETHSSERQIALVAGYSLGWIDETLRKLSGIQVEPLLVSVYQHTFRYEYSSVSFNTVKAMQTLIRTLADAGKKSIAFFALHKDTVGDLAKLRGYTSGMRACGLNADTSSIYVRRKAMDCGAQLLSDIRRYDAIVCTNDLLAIWLIRYLQKHGIRIPEDVAVTGFGNWSTVDHFRPRLTRMYTDLEELGCQAVRLHQYMQYNPRIGHCASMLECQLQAGETAPICSRRPADLPVKPYETSSLHYTADEDILSVLKLEDLVRNTDETDRLILSLLLRNETLFSIAEAVSVSESTVKYRLKRLLKICGFRDRQELLQLISAYHLFTKE